MYEQHISGLELNYTKTMGRHIQQKRKQNQYKIRKSRKELRKEQRKLKKAKKNEFFQRKNKVTKSVIENANDEVQMNNNTDTSVRKSQERKILKELRERERYRKLQLDMKNQRIKQLKEANQHEDRVIRKLEKQLKLNKKKLKSIPKAFTTDGLDCILHRSVLEYVHIESIVLPPSTPSVKFLQSSCSVLIYVLPNHLFFNDK
jgi:hypothetical protein